MIKTEYHRIIAGILKVCLLLKTTDIIINLNKTFTLAVSLILFLFSCKKNNPQPTGDAGPAPTSTVIETAPDEVLYNTTIDAVSYGLLDFSDNAIFKAVLNAELGKQFDGDDNVILKDLAKELLTVGIDLGQSMKNSLINNGRPFLVPFIDGAISGFSYFDRTLYPQIYVPYINNQNLNGHPTICTNYDDDGILPGISRLDLPNGGLNYATTNVDESYASSNLTWIISVNENVDNGGALIPKPPMTGVTGPPGYRVLYIDQVNVSDKKEGWGNGRAELTYAGYHILPNCNSSPMGGDGQAYCLLANAELNTWYTPNYFSGARLQLANSVVLNYWREDISEQVMLLYYERDVRNKFARVGNPSGTCGNGDVHYVSKEDPYGIINPAYSDFATVGTNSYKTYSLSGMQMKYRGARF